MNLAVNHNKTQPTGREKAPETFGLETVCPDSIGLHAHAGYCTRVKGFNIALLNEAKEVFRNAHPQLLPLFESGQAALVAVGSDARHEKGIHSPIELVVIGADALASRCLGTQINYHFKEFQRNSRTEIFDPDVDIRNAGRGPQFAEANFLFSQQEANHCFSYRVNTHQQGLIISPSRMLDAKVFIGSPELLNQVRAKMLTNLIENPKLLDEAIKDYKGKVKDALRICRTGKNRRGGQDMVHFDRETGELFYDGKSKLSVKLGPLRAIQQKMTHDMLVALRDKKISPEDLLADHIETAQSTNTRLSIIASMGRYDTAGQQFADFADTYEFCLWLYHRSQQSTTFTDSAKVERIVQLSNSERDELDLRLEFLSSLEKSKLFDIK